MSHSDLLKRLLPPFAYEVNGACISAELAAEGAALDAAQQSADALLAEFDPRTTAALFADWERVAALPDNCCGTDQALTLAQRRQQLIAKITSHGGQSRQFFIDLAAKLGYHDVGITEFRMANCEGNCEQVLRGEDWLFAWQMDIGDYIAIHEMTCTDPCDSPLRSWQATELQCRVEKTKPAHTVALLNWFNAPFADALHTAPVTISRFDPKYWRIDGPRTTSFCVTPYGNGLEATFLLRRNDVMCGLVWDSVDTKDHLFLAYETSKDYRNCVWDFDVELSPSMPVLNDPQLSPVISIYAKDAAGKEVVAYVPLFRYATQPAARSSHITIDWNTVKSGFYADQPIESQNIEQLMLACITSAYVAPTAVSSGTLRSNSYGDVRIDTGINVAAYMPGYLFTVQVLDLTTNAVIWSTATSESYAYFTISDSIPLFGFPATYLRVRVLDATGTLLNTIEAAATPDDSWLQKVIVFAGQSNAAAHFFALSGATSDLQTATVLRNQIAQSLGFSPAEVMPVNAAVGSSAADRAADEKGYALADNYWYDIQTSSNGPRLTNFISLVSPLASKVCAIIWSQGEADVSANWSGASTPATYKVASNAIFDVMRTLVPATQSPIIWQITATSFLGAAPNPPETNPALWTLYRDVQRTISYERPDIIIGSWCPGANVVSGYVQEIANQGWIHYTSAVYHAIVADLFDTIINAVDRTDLYPTNWIAYMAPAYAGNAAPLVASWSSGLRTVIAQAATAVTSGLPFVPAEEGYIRITNSVVTGVNATLKINKIQVPAHSIGMATSYDDHYDQNPARIVQNCYDLGYRDWINHYVGMSSYPTRIWDAVESRDIAPAAGATPLVNPAATKWHTAFAAACQAHNYKLIQSVSFEINSEWVQLGWEQRNWLGEPGASGYVPPSYFLSPCNTNAMAYLHQVFTEFAATAAGAPVYMQVGEPWWWVNSDGKPCIYDYPAKLAFNAATGLYMDDFGTAQSGESLTASPYPEMKAFLQDALGAAVQGCRTAVRTKYPAAQCGVLFFVPSILSPYAGIMQTINYPKAQYAYPNFDIMFTEAYDWIVTGQLSKAYIAMDSPITDLGYPPAQVQYLAGFVPDPLLAPLYGFTGSDYRKQIWQRMIGNVKNNQHYGIAKQHLWSYVQVMFDSITLLEQNNQLTFYIGTESVNAIRDDTPYI